MMIAPPSQLPSTETNLLLPGAEGNLQAIITPPKEQHAKQDWISIICHPHPLQEGTMHNKVVTTLSRLYRDLGAYTIRFNFRGVGQSEGSFARGEGEQEDVYAIIDWLDCFLPRYRLSLSGFSFGSYVAAACAERLQPSELVSVAPPVHHYDFSSLGNIQCPWLVVQGIEDEVVPVDQVQAWAQAMQPQQAAAKPQLTCLEDTGHFFHGKLTQLRDIIQPWLLAQEGS